MTTITAYHVSSEATLSVVERNVCDDPKRDGFLVGANVACFSTTLFRGRLPTQSPYPRGAEPGERVYRYVVQFNPRDFIKFKMAQSPRQVHYLLLQRSRRAELDVAKRLRERGPSMEDLDWDTYFPNGRVNEYTNDGMFVNVVFWHDVQVANARGVAIVKQRIDPFSYPPVHAMKLSVWLSRIPDERTSDSSAEDAEEEEEDEDDDSNSSSASPSESDDDEQSPSDSDDSSDGHDSDSDSDGSNSVSASASDSSSEDSAADDSDGDVDALASAFSNTKLK